MENYKGGRRSVSLLSRCRKLRLTATDAERAIWELLRRRSLQGLKFRRQHQVGACILDFYCAECRLGVEVDGSQHDSTRGRDYDAARTNYLEALGITIVRCTNEEALRHPQIVVARVREAIRASIRRAF